MAPTPPTRVVTLTEFASKNPKFNCMNPSSTISPSRKFMYQLGGNIAKIARNRDDEY